MPSREKRVRIRSIGILSLAAAITLVFSFAPIFSLSQLEYPARPFGSGTPCDQTTYFISRYAWPSASLFGFGAVRFVIENYSEFCDKGIGYIPYSHSFYILTWDPSNVSEYLNSLAACPLCP